MTASLQYYCRRLPTTRRIKLMRLDECLHRLGVGAGLTHGRWRKKKDRWCIGSMNDWDLIDLFHTAKAIHRQKLIELHPDNSTDPLIIKVLTEACYRLNELWNRIKYLFQKKGIMA